MVLRLFPLCAAIFLFATNAPLWAEELEVILGPKQFVRTTGHPNVFNESFQTDASTGVFRLVMDNGGVDGRNRVSSATVHLNGQLLVEPSAFNQKIEHLERPITLQSNNTLKVDISSAPEGFVTIKVVCVSECSSLKIELTFPTPNSTLNALSTMVRGRVVTSSCPEVGVRVNGLLASTLAAEFAAPNVPLTVGPNPITATATNNCGNTATATITVQAAQPSSGNSVGLSISPKLGVVNQPINMGIHPFLEHDLQSVAWDFDGDGQIDQSGPDLFDTSHAYSEPGLYLPTVVLTDSQNMQVSEQGVVQIISQPALEQELVSKLTSMLDALGQGKVEEAASFISLSRRDRFRGQYSATTPEQLAYLANVLRVPMTLYEVRERFAILRSTEEALVNGILLPIEVECLLDHDGIWRFRSL